MFRLWIKSEYPSLQNVEEEQNRRDDADVIFRDVETKHLRGFSLSSTLIPELSDLIAKFPRHIASKLLLGRIFNEDHKFDEAVEILEECYRYDHIAKTDLVAAYLGKVDSNTQNGDQFALDIFNKVLDIDRRNPVAIRKRSEIYVGYINRALETDNTEDAFKYFRELTVPLQVNFFLEIVSNRPEINGQIKFELAQLIQKSDPTVDEASEYNELWNLYREDDVALMNDDR